MKTCRTLLLIAASSGALLFTTPTANAIGTGSKEVHINEKYFAKLSEVDQQHVLELRDRAEALMATDRNSLSADERVALRSEWKSLKQDMRAANAGGGTVIYISTAGIIIILLLLIILL